MAATAWFPTQLVLCFFMCFALSRGATPQFASLPISLNVGELETANRLLYTLSVTDASQHSFTCTQTSTSTPGNVAGLFTMARDPETNQWKIRTNVEAGTAFDTAETYTITVVCTDGNGLSGTGTVSVSVVPGQRITFDTLPRSETRAALTTGSGVSIHTATASDLLGSTLEYFLTTEPVLDDTYFIINQNTGEVRTNRALSGIDSSIPSVKLKIRASDGLINITEDLTVLFTNQNTIPTTTTLPLNQTKLESLATGTTLFTIATVDPDTTQTHTYTKSCTPLAYDDKFIIDSNGNFKLNSPYTLNYEEATLHSCNIYISDGIHTGGPFLYQLTVADANERCSFGQSLYSVSTTEGTANSVTMSPAFTVTDVDAADSVFTYSLLNANNSNRFSIDSTTGQMTYAVDYDIDNSNMPSLLYLTVIATDQGGPSGTALTCTTQVQITISDINDNAPQFPSSSYSITVSQLTSPGSVIGTITPTDADSGSNADTSCSSSLISGTSGYYTVGADCNIYLSKAIDFENGRVMTYRATAVDDGSPQLTGTTTVDIIYTEVSTTTVTTTTTAATYNFWDHPENIAMFVMTLLAGLALLGGLLYCCFRYCCGAGSMDCFGRGGDCCPRRRYPPRQVTPETPPPKRKVVETIERERSPVIVREQPRIVERPRLVRTMIAQPRFGPPAYSSWRGVPPSVGGFMGPDPYSGALLP